MVCLYILLFLLSFVFIVSTGEIGNQRSGLAKGDHLIMENSNFKKMQPLGIF